MSSSEYKPKQYRPLPVNTIRLLIEGEYNTEVEGIGIMLIKRVEDLVDEWMDKYDHYNLSYILTRAIQSHIDRTAIYRRRARQQAEQNENKEY